jgi:hypothetical protein
MAPSGATVCGASHESEGAFRHVRATENHAGRLSAACTQRSTQADSSSILTQQKCSLTQVSEIAFPAGHLRGIVESVALAIGFGRHLLGLSWLQQVVQNHQRKTWNSAKADIVAHKEGITCVQCCRGVEWVGRSQLCGCAQMRCFPQNRLDDPRGTPLGLSCFKRSNARDYAHKRGGRTDLRAQQMGSVRGELTGNEAY